MIYKLTNPPNEVRSRELRFQHAVGFILFQDMRKCAIDRIPSNTDDSTRELIDYYSSDPEKITAFKWLNELTHRVWNIIFGLQQDENSDSVGLYENMKFYAEQSLLLRSHLVLTTIIAFKNFLERGSISTGS